MAGPTGSRDLNQIAVYRSSINSTYHTIGVAGFVRGLCYDGQQIWGVTSANTNNIMSIQLNSMNVTYHSGPTGMVNICYDGRYLWRTQNGSNNLVSFNPATPTSLNGSYPLGTGTYGICFDGKSIWVACKNNAFIYTTGGTYVGGVTGTDLTDAPYNGCCLDGYNVWFAGGYLYRASSITHALTFSSPLDNDCICFDGTYIWTYSSISGGITKNLFTRPNGPIKTVQTIPSAGESVAMCSDGTYIWAAQFFTQ